MGNYDNHYFCDPYLPHDIGWHDGVGVSQIPFEPHTAVLVIIVINYPNYHQHYRHNCNNYLKLT